MSKSKSTQLNCFSPPVMIATVVIELALAAYTAWRYTFNNLARLIAVTFVMLATFQISEYFVCTGSAGNIPTWSRLGFVAITTLPPLGIHIMHNLAGKSAGRVVYGAYATMLGFIGFFLLFPGVFNSYQCSGNYVVFHLRARAGGVYWVYYMGWLLTGIALGARWANELLAKGAVARRQLQSVRALIVGWFVFLVPTAVVNIINPTTRAGIPSIMCGFAVLFALILGLYILPRAVPSKAILNTAHKPA